MTERQPDIEIYLKRTGFDDICDWLKIHFKIIATRPIGVGKLLDLSFRDEHLQCLVIEKAAKAGYVSVWFKQNRTPWQDDLACAEDAHRVIKVESRCSAGGWDKSEKENGNWYRLCNDEKFIINWLE